MDENDLELIGWLVIIVIALVAGIIGYAVRGKKS
jgi:hypothetical protein